MPPPPAVPPLEPPAKRGVAGGGGGLREEVGRELSRFDWSQSNARAGLRGVPGLALVLIAGLVAGDPAAGAVAVAGAMPVGFGSFQRVGRSRVAPMLLSSLGMGLAAFSGSLLSPSEIGAAIVTAVWAFAYGLLTAAEPGLAWVGLQCVIVAAVAGGYPVGPSDAITRGFLTLGGGLVQMGIITAIWRFQGQPPVNPGGPAGEVKTEVAVARLSWDTLRRNLRPGTEIGGYAWRLGVTLALAVIVYHELALRNGYWVPMTAAIVLKPGFRQTFARSLARLVGTLVGAGLTTLLAATLRPGPVALAALVVGSAWVCYALLNVNYGLYAVGITSYVVFLLALLGLPQTEVVWHRTLNTALGGALALTAYGYRLPAQVRRLRRSRGSGT